jgi:uncharacterized protein
VILLCFEQLSGKIYVYAQNTFLIKTGIGSALVGTQKFHLHDGKKGAALAIRVTPRASRNEIAEILSDGTVRIRLTAPPAEGKANEALVDFLAEVLNVPRSHIEIVAGITGRDKLVSVLDLDTETVHQKILQQLV